MCGSFSSSVLESQVLDLATIAKLSWPEHCVEAATTIIITISIRSVAILNYFLVGGGRDSALLLA